MDPTIIDPSLYCQFEDYNHVGIIGSYVNGLLLAGTDKWKTKLDTTLEQL